MSLSYLKKNPWMKNSILFRIKYVPHGLQGPATLCYCISQTSSDTLPSLTTF